MKSLSSAWRHCALLLTVVIALFLVHGSSCLPGAVAGAAPRRPHGGPSHQLGRPSAATSQPPRSRPIARPAECKHDAIFADCFMCGKVAEALLVYRQCCHRETEIVEFCTRLLT